MQARRKEKKKLTNTSVPTTPALSNLNVIPYLVLGMKQQIELRALKYSPCPRLLLLPFLEVITLLNLVCTPSCVFSLHIVTSLILERKKLRFREVKGLAPVTQINSKWYRRGAPGQCTNSHLPACWPSVPHLRTSHPIILSTPSLQAGPGQTRPAQAGSNRDHGLLLNSWFLPCSQARLS